MKLLITTKNPARPVELKWLTDEVREICIPYFAEVYAIELKKRTLYLTINTATERVRLIELIERLRHLAHTPYFANVIYSIELDTMNIIELDFDAELIF